MGWSLSDLGDAADRLDFSGDRSVGGQGDDTITGTNHSDEILADAVPSDSQGGNDQVFARGGDDLVYGFGGNNLIDGGGGDDDLTTADGDDAIYGGAGEDSIQSGRGTDLVHGGTGNDDLRGGEGNDLLYGEEGDDRVIGGSDHDTLHGGPGHDWLEGLYGSDTFAWANINDGGDAVVDFTPALDRLQLDTIVSGFDGNETSVPLFVRIVPASGSQDGLLQVDADGPGGSAGWQGLAVVQGQPNLRTQALYQVGDLVIDDHVPSQRIDPLAYIASYDDLIRAFGTDAQAGKWHYLVQGFDERRVSTFDGLQYIASYGDLIDALGPNRNAGATHFITSGLDEQRLRDGFDEVQYVANYKDLQDAFGTDYKAATRHYITNGYHEERTDKPLGDPPPLAASGETAAGAAQGDFLL